MGTLTIQEHVPLAPLTTIGVGGMARFFAHVRTEQELVDAVFFCDRNKLPLTILGGGSNLLIQDEGFPGLVLHADLKGEMRLVQNGDRVRCDVPGGTPWDDFVLEACKQDLSGVECLAGIPGLTGGTPVQNVGAYGQEVSQTIRAVRAFGLRSQSFVQLAAEECQFRYRSSRFNREETGRFILTAVSFELRKSAKPKLTYAELRTRFTDSTPTPFDVYSTVLEIRRGKGMLLSPEDPDSRSAGSFFKNPLISQERFAKIGSLFGGPSEVPHWSASLDEGGSRRVKLAAAWLVQTAGFPKGFVEGAVGISTKHSLALINRGGATCAEIYRLRDRIRSAVDRKFEIELEQEPIEMGPHSASAYRTASRPMFGSLA